MGLSVLFGGDKDGERGCSEEAGGLWVFARKGKLGDVYGREDIGSPEGGCVFKDMDACCAVDEGVEGCGEVRVGLRG